MEFYNKHFIRIREDGCIVDGFSDAFREPTEDAICINEHGGYQFRLIYVEHDEVKNAPVRRMTEENPSLFDWGGMIPLYRWTEEEYIAKRTKEEIEAERAKALAPTSAQQIAELKAQLEATDYKVIKCSEAWMSGAEMPYDIVELHKQRQTLRDQINALEGGAN